ncbi:MAG: tetratricopeptide repeat protein [Deltaproteobacteria bacterium]|nr:tetratricopeptide repeat protein [Deltaproteobacteria bacterium]
MAKQKKAEKNKNTEKPIEKIPEKRGVSYGVVALAFVAGILVGVLLTLYKTGGSPAMPPPASQADHKSTAELSDQIAGLEFRTSQNPGDIAGWIQLGNLCFDANLPEKAITAYEKALALNPDNADVLTDLGVMYRKAGKFDKAIQNFDKAVSVDPKHEIARFNKGIVLMHDLNNPKGAIQAWEELLAINPLAMAPNGQSIDEMLKKMKQQ